jgi:peptide/nickel transport system permease protein
VVPGGTLTAGLGGVDGLEGGRSFDDQGIEVRP